LGLTSGTVSVRLNRLSGKQIVTRQPSADDARSTLVTLTDRGLELFAQVGPAHLHNEDVLLSALTGPERTQLAGLLRKLLVSVEHERAASPLGMVLAPAHIARRMRTAVGLSDTPGLLVTDVTADSLAAEAGLQPGDLLTAIDGDPLQSCVDLAEHSAGRRSSSPSPRRPLELTLLRGSEQKAVRFGALSEGGRRRPRRA
jgi:hypothetical protein